MTKFNSYLQNHFANLFGIDMKEHQLADLSLNMLALAHRERSDSAVQKAPQGTITDLAYHYADTLLDGGKVVFYDALMSRTYYAVEVEGAIVAVYYAMGPWLNIYSAVCSKPEILPKLGVIGYQFQDLKIIDKIFGIPEKNPVVVVEPSPVTSVTPELPVVEWYTPPVLVKRDEEAAINETPVSGIPNTRIITQVHELPVAKEAPAADSVPAPVVGNQMQQAFERAAGTGNVTRGADRRRDHGNRQGSVADRATASA